MKSIKKNIQGSGKPLHYLSWVNDKILRWR